MFKKEEKQLWYEKHKMRADAEPANCLKCRRQIRILKSENKKLSEILEKDEVNISLDELTTVVEIFRLWNKDHKVKYYESLIKKRLKK